METNFILIGHVDHGKSTCAGRILVDTGVVDERDVERAIKDAEENGMKGWWLAYLLDMDDERIKGKTSEHTVIPIEYKGKKINMVDVPGHRKYVREMITGMNVGMNVGMNTNIDNTTNIAVLICSAKKGEIEAGIRGQTYEHLMLTRGMGISKLIVAINKMDHDTVNWDMDVFDRVKNKVDRLISMLKFSNVQYVPISALNGTNVVHAKSNDSKIPSLLDTIINTDATSKPVEIYKDKKRIKAKCMFINIDSVITAGYSCNLHSGPEVVGCTIKKIFIGKPFITNKDKGFIDVGIEMEEPIDIYTFIILREGDKTVGMGKVTV